MQGFIALVFSIFLLSAPAMAVVKTKNVIVAAPAVSVKKAFTYCIVTGPVQNFRSGTIWATPVFEFEYDASEPVDPTGKHANAFYNQIGGGGEKSCGGLNATADEAQVARDSYKATMTVRMGLWKTKWIDVAYTPAPWAPSTLVIGARVPQFLYCWASDMEPNVRKSVASNVLSITMPPMGDPAYMKEHAWYDEHFKQDVLSANGLPGGTGVCIYKDSFAEASESLNTMRKTFSGFNLRWVDAIWNPAGPATAAPEKEIGKKTPIGKKPMAAKLPAITRPDATPVIQAKAPDVTMYCTATLNTVKEVWYSSIWTEIESQSVNEHLAAARDAFFEHVKTTEPDFFIGYSLSDQFPPSCHAVNANCTTIFLRNKGRDALVSNASCVYEKSAWDAVLANPKQKTNVRGKFKTARTLEWLPASTPAP